MKALNAVDDDIKQSVDHGKIYEISLIAHWADIPFELFLGSQNITKLCLNQLWQWLDTH